MLSGATDLEKRPEPGGAAASRCAGSGAASAPACREGHGIARTHEGRDVACAGRLTPATVDEVLPPADRAPARAASRSRPAATSSRELELGRSPAPRALPVSRLSYSGLEGYRRCGYRFYLERALRLPRVESPFAPAASQRPSAGLERAAARHGRARAARAARLRAARRCPATEDVAR